ncbi:MAG: hypothetical protein ACJ8AD_09595 [Gemmatimonadaceae bacterium]
MNTLTSGQQLGINADLVSDNGLVRLLMQADGNLVLYRTLFRLPLWASNTVGKAVDHVEMRADGNLVALSAAGAVLWETATSGNPGATARLQDDGNFVVYDSAGVARWETNTTPNFSAPAIQYLDARGYEYVETSEWLKNAVSGAPCSLLMQWPDYATTIVEDTINGEDVVIQLWKGWCPHPFRNFPGGIGAEVGIYRRVLGKIAPRDFPPPNTLDMAASLLAGSVINFGNRNLWWPFPQLNAEITYTLTNPVNNQLFYDAGPQTGYWLAKWMDNDSYAIYQRDQGVRNPSLPTWWPGNSNTPRLTSSYMLDYTINGKTYPRY